MKYLLDDAEMQELKAFIEFKGKPIIAKTLLIHGRYSDYIGLEFLGETETINLLRQELEATGNMYRKEVSAHIYTKNYGLKQKKSWF